MGDHKKAADPDEIPAIIPITEEMTEMQRIEAEEHNDAVLRLLTLKTRLQERMRESRLLPDLANLQWK